MDAVFSLDAASRAEFLQLLMHSTGCTYICLWSYLPQANCLMYWDGCYNEANIQPGALRLFLEYQRLVFQLENDQTGAVPGFAFRNNRPYIELAELELLNRASHQIQRQLYQEAGIKTVAFMGCRSGEIELGSPNVLQLNMEMEMRSFFAEDFSRQQSPALGGGDHLPQLQITDPNLPSSSSSSLRSPSAGGSPVDSSFIVTIPTASHPHVPITDQTAAPTPSSSLQQQQQQQQAMSSSMPDPHQQAMQALSQMRSNIQLPTIESENAAMTRAILAVLTSPHSSSSSSTSLHSQPQQSQDFPDNYNANYQLNPNASAFKRYASKPSSRLGGGSNPTTPPSTSVRASLRAQSMLKRAIFFYRKHNLARHEHMLRSRPTTNQLHHMMSERKRREKLNESFHALRSLLPSGTKKDKASVLASTREHLASLKGQIEELSRRNQLLEAQVLPAPREAAASESSSDDERFNVWIMPVSESTSQQRVVDLRVRVRGERSILDMLIQLLDFLKLDRSVSLMSVEADTQLTLSGSSVNHVNLRLRIEGNGWDESAFLEAVRRLVA